MSDSEMLVAILTDEVASALAAWEDIHELEVEAELDPKYMTPLPSAVRRVSLPHIESIEKTCEIEMIVAKEHNDPDLGRIKARLREIRRIRRSARYYSPGNRTIILDDADYIALRALL